MDRRAMRGIGSAVRYDEEMTTSQRFAPVLFGCLVGLSVVVPSAAAPTEVRFPAADGLEITADLYLAHADAKTPFIVLFHQAGWSRGEYREIAPKLGGLGFNSLAVDQRSGGEINGVVNQTHRRAREKGLDTEYVDAIPDLEAAVAWARKQQAHGDLLVWGSSYSAALVLRFAGEHPDRIEGALAFSPGEYFQSSKRPADWITRSAAKIGDPVFITSARQEKGAWWSLWEAIRAPGKTFFLPETAGNHGSRALWERFEDHADYWVSVRAFLEPFRRNPPLVE